MSTTTSIHLTERQASILAFIADEINEGCPPSYREIGKRFDIVSLNGVARHIHTFCRKGLLRLEPDTRRAIRLTDMGKSVAGSLQRLSEA